MHPVAGAAHFCDILHGRFSRGRGLGLYVTKLEAPYRLVGLLLQHVIAEAAHDTGRPTSGELRGLHAVAQVQEDCGRRQDHYRPILPHLL